MSGFGNSSSSGNTSPPFDMTSPISIDPTTADNRSVTVCTERAGFKWDIDKRDNVTVNESGTEFTLWSKPCKRDTGKICVFGKKMDTEQHSNRYQFVRSNHEKQGLEISSPVVLPTDFDSKDPRIFHFKASAQDAKTPNILQHCSSKGYVTVNENKNLELNRNKELADTTIVNPE